MPSPPATLADGVFDLDFALPPPLPLLTSCRDSRSAPLYQHSFLASPSAYCDLPEPSAANDGDVAEAILLTSPAATFKEQGREISGLVRSFSRPSIPLPADSAQPDRHKRNWVARPLPRHPALVPSKSSPALHRSPSKSPPSLPVHKEEVTDPSQQYEDKHYSPADSTSLLSSSTHLSTLSTLASSPSASSPFSLSSSTSTLLTPSSCRSLSAYSLPSRSVSIDQLSAHVNPFHTQAAKAVSAGRRRSVTAANSLRGRQRRVLSKHEDKEEEEVDGRTVSTASTCSLASTSLSTFTSPSPYFTRVDHDNDADVDSDSDSDSESSDDDSLLPYTPSRSPPSHFTFAASSSLQASSSFSSSSSSSSICHSPHSPLFDTSLSGGRHSADPHFSAGIGVFAGQLQALRRMRSANTLTSPSNNITNQH